MKKFIVAIAVLLSYFSSAVQANAYPDRPVVIIVPYSAGGGMDIAARLLAGWLTQRLGQTFVVENRPVHRIVETGQPAGILATQESILRRYIDAGSTFVGIGIDSRILASGADDLAARYDRRSSGAAGLWAY